MTKKQENILKAALELFAKDGYHAVSTSKVAKLAGVSEALIFRHFENKEGLLKAILHQGAEMAKKAFSDIVATNDSKEIIRKTLELPFNIEKSEYEVWRLTYSLKWQTNNYNIDLAEPLKLVLSGAFKKLKYKDPNAETELVMMFVDGAATALLLHEPGNKKNILKSLKEKYSI